MIIELVVITFFALMIYYTGFVYGYSKRSEQEFTEDWDIDDLSEKDIKATLNGINYRCMADLIAVNYANKTIQPIDLKTSGHAEWDFYKSFIDWSY